MYRSIFLRYTCSLVIEKVPKIVDISTELIYSVVDNRSSVFENYNQQLSVKLTQMKREYRLHELLEWNLMT